VTESSAAYAVVFEDAAGEWRWQARAANHRIIATSGEGFTRLSDAVRAARESYPGIPRAPRESYPCIRVVRKAKGSE